MEYVKIVGRLKISKPITSFPCLLAEMTIPQMGSLCVQVATQKGTPELSGELFTHWVGHKKMVWMNFRVSNTLLAEIETINRKRGDKSFSETVRYLIILGLKEYKKRQTAWLQFMTQYHQQPTEAIECPPNKS